APDEDELFEAAEFFCRTHKVELFAKAEVKKFLIKTSNAFEQNLLISVDRSLSNKTKKILDGILEESAENDNKEGDNPERDPKKKFVLIDLKKDTSHLKKESIRYEIAKYEFLKKIQLPKGLS